MPLGHSPSHGAFISNLKAEMHAGKPQKQALAIAFDVQRRAHHADGGAPDDAAAAAIRLSRRHLAFGGMGTMPEAPYFERSAARQDMSPYGFSSGTGGGRTDKNNVDVGAGAYVLPADVVSGLGEGNSLAGAKVFDSILHTEPFGISPPQAHPRSGERMPRPPTDPELAAGLFEGTKDPPISPTMARGGDPGDDGKKVPIVTADGEVIVSPDDVARIGAHYFPAGRTPTRRALVKRGHDVIDGMVKEIRGRTIAKLKQLPGPVGSHNAKEGHNRHAKAGAG